MGPVVTPLPLPSGLLDHFTATVSGFAWDGAAIASAFAVAFGVGCLLAVVSVLITVGRG